jgi:uncharacterized protein (TIGR02466 family)
MSLIKLIPFFNPIYISSIDVELSSIEESILRIRDNEKGVSISNAGGWQSKGYSAKEKFFMSSLISRINLEVAGVYEDLGINKEPQLGNFWFNVNEKYDYNHTHNHPGSYISAVLYVKAPDNCGQIVFERPDPFHDWIHESIPMDNNVAKIFQQPRDKMLLIFPAYIRHYVEMNMSDSQRISIAFNYK